MPKIIGTRENPISHDRIFKIPTCIVAVLQKNSCIYCDYISYVHAKYNNTYAVSRKSIFIFHL